MYIVEAPLLILIIIYQLILYYLTFSFLDDHYSLQFKLKNSWLIVIAFFISLLSNDMIGVTILGTWFFILGLYIQCYRYNQRHNIRQDFVKYKLFTNIFLGYFIYLLIDTIIWAVFVLLAGNLYNRAGFIRFELILADMLITMITHAGIIVLMKYLIKHYLNTGVSIQLFNIVLSVLYIYYAINNLVFRKIGIYSELIVYISVTTLFLFIITIFSIYFVNQYVLRVNQNKVNEQALFDLQVYTKNLESAQLQLREFRHDHKNMLIYINTLVGKRDWNELVDYTDSLMDYSKEELEVPVSYTALNNIEHQPMKHIILNKLLGFERENIRFTFECVNRVTEVNMNDVELIRMLGILMDNALEYLSVINEGEFIMIIYQASDYLEIEVVNTYLEDNQLPATLHQAGYSTKENHEGLGLSYVQRLALKYSHLQTDIYIENQLFNASILIER